MKTVIGLMALAIGAWLSLAFAPGGCTSSRNGADATGRAGQNLASQSRSDDSE